jgi:hypothetical protein
VAGAGGGGGEGGGTGGGALVVDLRMTLGQVRKYVRTMIRDRTDGRVRKLALSCTRTSDRSFRCRLSWRIGRRAYKGRAELWHYEQAGQPYWTYVFQGKRRKAGCAGCRVSRLKW